MAIDEKVAREAERIVAANDELYQARVRDAALQYDIEASGIKTRAVLKAKIPTPIPFPPTFRYRLWSPTFFVLDSAGRDIRKLAAEEGGKGSIVLDKGLKAYDDAGHRHLALIERYLASPVSGAAWDHYLLRESPGIIDLLRDLYRHGTGETAAGLEDMEVANAIGNVQAVPIGMLNGLPSVKRHLVTLGKGELAYTIKQYERSTRKGTALDGTRR